MKTTSVCTLILSYFALSLQAQTPPASLHGAVTDPSDASVPGAVVQLKNMKTLEVRSFIAKEQGDYFFHGLATDVDYELKAQFDGKASAPKVLSSFDSHAEAVMNLQLKP